MRTLADAAVARRLILRRMRRVGVRPVDLFFIDNKRWFGKSRTWFAVVSFDEGQFLTIPVLAQDELTTIAEGATYTSDSTWNNTDNVVEAVGAGGSGGVNKGNAGCATGGGGGAYGEKANYNFATPGTSTEAYTVRAGGASRTQSVNGNTDGAVGGACFFGPSGSAFAGGAGGSFGDSSNAAGPLGGGAGGTTAGSVGTTTRAGGDGGDATGGASTNIATGGGGAAGTNGVGIAGTNTGTNNTATAGGAGDAGSGGSGGTAGGGTGGTGTEWTSHGSGGGGGGARSSTAGQSPTGGQGGLYGGGGGGGSQSNTTGSAVSGAGRQGLVVLTWTPLVIHLGEATFAGAGNLSALARLGLRAQATLAGAGSLSALLNQNQSALINFPGAGDLSAYVNQRSLAFVTFPGDGTLSILLNKPHVISARFEGAGALSIEGRAVQVIRPNADEVDGSWTNELGGTELFSHIDENIIDDADYIQSSPDPVADLTKIAFGNTNSSVTAPAVLRYRYKKEGIGSVNLQVRLLQGVTEIASWVHNDISALYVTAQQTLTEGQVEAITNPNDLFIEFTADSA